MEAISMSEIKYMFVTSIKKLMTKYWRKYEKEIQH